LQDEL